jgi:hypothetical protein
MLRARSMVFGIAAFVAVAFAACSSDSPPDDDDEDDDSEVGGSAGTSGTGPGGESGDDGGAGTGGSAQGGSGQGGTATGGTAGEGGEGASSGSTSSGGAGSGGAGSGGLGGSGGSGPTVGCERATLIDDFEDMNSQSCPPLLKEWWAWRDSGSPGTIVPSDGMLLPQTLPGGARDGSLYGMHLTGTGFSSSSGSAAILVDVRETDLSTYQGIRFWSRTASAALSIRVEFGTRNTVDTNYGGSCVPTNACWDRYGAFRDFGPTWQIQDVSFAQLVQEGWGLAVAKDLDHVFEIRFLYKPGGTNPSSFDFWIDDVELY